MVAADVLECLLSGDEGVGEEFGDGGMRRIFGGDAGGGGGRRSISVELSGWTRGWNSELEGSEVDDEVEGREVSLAVIPKDRSMGEQSSVSHAGRWLDPVGCGIVKFCRRAPSRKSSVDNRKSSSSMSASSTPSRWRKLLDADRPLGMTAPRPMARSYLLIDTIPRYWIKKGKEIQYKNVEKREKALQTQRIWPSDARKPLPRQVTVFAQRRECPGKDGSS